MKNSADLLVRLDGCAERIADFAKGKRAEMDRRDSLICQLIEGGEKYAAVAKASRRSIGTVAAIVGRGDPLAEERQELADGVFTTTAP